MTAKLFFRLIFHSDKQKQRGEYRIYNLKLIFYIQATPRQSLAYIYTNSSYNKNVYKDAKSIIHKFNSPSQFIGVSKGRRYSHSADSTNKYCVYAITHIFHINRTTEKKAHNTHTGTKQYNRAHQQTNDI